MGKKPAPKFDDTREYKKRVLTSAEIYTYFSVEEPKKESVPATQEESILAPKVECDHIVGIARELVELNCCGVDDWNLYLLMSSSLPRFEKDEDHDLYTFQHCPECGEKLTTPNE